MESEANVASSDKIVRAVDDALWLKARGKATAEGKTMRELIEELLREYVKGKR